MADDEGKELLWYGAGRHTLMPLDERLHIPKSLHRVLNQNKFEIRASTDIAGVIAGCRNRPATWISNDLAFLYLELAKYGIVQTYETWHQGQLAGGVLGMCIGGAFIGESMFTAVDNAGKVALVKLCHHLQERGFVVFDAQLTNDHLARFGSYEVEAKVYKKLLAEALLATPMFIG